MKKVNLLCGNYEKLKQALEGETYFEFELQYDSCNKELDRFLWESRKEMAQYKNHYSGPVVIDLSKWNQKQDKAFFEAFLYYLQDRGEQLTIIMSEKPTKQLLSCLEKHFDVNVKEFSLKERERETTRIGFYCEEEHEYVRSEV